MFWVIGLVRHQFLLKQIHMSEDDASSDIGFPFSLDTFDFYQLILTVQFHFSWEAGIVECFVNDAILLSSDALPATFGGRFSSELPE